KIEILRSGSPSVSIDALSTDTLRLVSSISKGEQYRDEEVRTARVLDTDLKTVYYQGLTMDSDRRYSMQFPKDAEGELILNNALYEKIVEEVSRLEQYDYQCTEQCASKLRALLIKERINASLGKTEKLKTKISRLINQLSAYQNEDGSWGWWKRQDGIARMTLYAMEVLQQAHQQGYLNSNYSNAREWIIRSYAGLSISDQLYALYLLKKEGRATESMVNAFLKLKEENWSDADRIYWVKIRDMIGKPVTADDLYPVYLSLNQHVIRPYCGNFFHDPRASVFMAYQLFSGTSLGDEWLKMFRAQLLNGQLEDNLNTYSRACMIEALCLSAMSQGAASAVAEVNINDTLKVKSFPYRMPIESGTYQLQHKGGIVYANATLRRSIRNPRPVDSVFRVQTQWIQDRSGSTHLKAGKPCTLQIDLYAFQGHEKVMLEIPVPSGMKVVSKPSFGTYTEYRQEKMILYFDQLPVGSYRFDVDMLPVFTGTFVQAPAHCSLMYYPYISGNNGLQEIQID
ncbi:MAG TPA: hypothetical protein PLP34_05525, partial [Chitinophagaceae bacterium]|nr:hypothetical protein [Chitinophagaceae bacterium]